MLTNPLTLVLGLVAAVSYGTADYLGARASKQLGPITSAFCMQLVGTLLFATYYLLGVHTIPYISPETWVYIAGSSVLIAGGVCALYMALAIGPVSVASPLSSAYPLVAAIVGLLFFHARLAPLQLVGVVLLVFGIMAAAGLFTLSKAERHLDRGPFFALLATLLWGVGFPLLAQAVDASGWQIVSLLQTVLMVGVMGGILLLRRRTERVTLRLAASSLSDRYIVGAGAMQMVAGLAINLGFTYDQAAGAVVVALSSTYPLLTMVLAFKQFKERIEAWLLAGAGCTVVGVVLLVL